MLNPGLVMAAGEAIAFGWAVASPHCKTLRPPTVAIVASVALLPVYVTPVAFVEKPPGRLFCGGAAYDA